MPVRAIAQESSLIGIESVEGSLPAAGVTKRLLAVGFNLVEAAEFDQIDPMGILVGTGDAIRQNWSTFEIGEGAYMDYNALAYLFSFLFGPATITTPGGATNAREWLWTPSAQALNKTTFSARKGTPTINGVAGTAEQALGCILTSLMLGFRRTARQELTGAGFGKQLSYDASIDVNEVVTLSETGTISGGTWTITFGGQTTSAIAHDADAATIEAAFEALSTVGAGNGTVTGGPIGTTPVVITFTEDLANTNVGPVTVGVGSLTGSTPGISVSVTQTGAPSDVPLVPVLAAEVDVFLDNAWSSLGTTKLTSDFSAEWSIEGIYNPLWVLNSAEASYKEGVLQRPGTGFKLELGNDSVSRALVTDMRAGTKKFPRVRAMKGANSIESGQAYELRIDSCWSINEAPAAGDIDGASTLPFGGRLVLDGVSGFWTRILLRNGLASL